MHILSYFSSIGLTDQRSAQGGVGRRREGRNACEDGRMHGPGVGDHVPWRRPPSSVWGGGGPVFCRFEPLDCGWTYIFLTTGWRVKLYSCIVICAVGLELWPFGVFQIEPAATPQYAVA